MLGSGIAQLEGYLRGGFLGVFQKLVCKEQALFGEIAKHRGVEYFFEAAFQTSITEAVRGTPASIE